MNNTFLHRRAVVVACAGALTLPILSRAQGAFPTKPIRLLLPTPPGSTFDTIARAASVEAEKRLGQPIVFEYKSGGLAARRPSCKPPDRRPTATRW